MVERRREEFAVENMLIQPNLYLVGTDHVFQFGAGAVYGGSTCSHENEQAFFTALNGACTAHRIRAIAEELNDQALAEMGMTTSVPHKLAMSLGLTHIYCDPDREERGGLQIRADNAVIAFGQISGTSQEEIEREILVEWNKRELFWCKRVENLSLWPVLFICGASHIPTFSYLLKMRGLPHEVVFADWEA